MPRDGLASLPRFRRFSGEFADEMQEAAYRRDVLESERNAARWTVLVLGVVFALEFIADAFIFESGPTLTRLLVTRGLALPLAGFCWLAIRRTQSPKRLELTMAAFWLAGILLYTVTAYPYALAGQDFDRFAYPLMAICALLVIPGRLSTAIAVALSTIAANVALQLALERHPLDVTAAGVLTATVIIIGGLFSVTLRRLRRQQHAHAALLETSNRALLIRTSELEERLIQAQQLESTGRLAGVVVHESNNAFSVISGLADLMMNGQVEPPIRSQLETIRETALTAASLTRDLLTFSRNESFAPAVLRLASFLDSMRPMLETSLPKGASLKLAVDEHHDPHVVADATQLRHVLLNLAINAGHAMQGEGWFAIRARNATLDEVSSSQLDRGRYVAIEAEDNGSGMSQDTLQRIFQPYFTTKKTGQGTGLGLSVVDWIVARNRGAISVNSKLGVGTTFTLLLPTSE